MSSATKKAQVRIRIEDEDAPVLDKLAGKSLSRPDVASVLLAAAIEAVRDCKGHIGYWPPKFQIVYQEREGRGDSNRLNETPPPPAKHRK
jgi:hypothetical protein